MENTKPNISTSHMDDVTNTYRVDGFKLFSILYLLSVCICGVTLNGKALLTLVFDVSIFKVRMVRT